MNVTSNIIKALTETYNKRNRYRRGHIFFEDPFEEPQDFKILTNTWPEKKALMKYIQDKNITFISMDQDIEYYVDYDYGSNDAYFDYLDMGYADLEFYYLIGDSDEWQESTVADLAKEAGDKVAEEFVNYISYKVEVEEDEY